MRSEKSRKYTKILSLSSLDGIFALGLLRRLYDLPFVFRLRVRKANNSIILGVPLSFDSELSNCFIIDNARCDRFIHSMGGNISLCQNDYGSLTDLIVDVFGLDIPDSFLNTIYNICTGAINEDLEAEKMYVAWLSSNFPTLRRIVDFIRDRNWERIKEWSYRMYKSPRAAKIKQLSDGFLKKPKVVDPGIYVLRYNVDDWFQRKSIRLAIEKLRPNARVVVAVGVHGNNRVAMCYIASIRSLEKLYSELESSEWITIARPHLLRIIMGESYIDYNSFTSQFLMFLKRRLRRLRF